MKTERTIRIFIGSSITELELERAKLMSFIQGLNNKYHQRGVFIEGHICEETPNNMREGGSQQMHNDYISGIADATIFMFYHKAGAFTMKELELARKAFLEKGKPNVYVFFKAVDKATDAGDEIQNAVSLVFNDYGHYYKIFDDVDTVKLELLQFLMELLPGKSELLVKDGAVYMNGELVKDISAEKIFAYQNNPKLAEIKERIAELLNAMTGASSAGDVSEALRISAELGQVQKEYHELECSILKQLISILFSNHLLNSSSVSFLCSRQSDISSHWTLLILEGILIFFSGSSRIVISLFSGQHTDIASSSRQTLLSLVEYSERRPKIGLLFCIPSSIFLRQSLPVSISFLSIHTV